MSSVLFVSSPLFLFMDPVTHAAPVPPALDSPAPVEAKRGEQLPPFLPTPPVHGSKFRPCVRTRGTRRGARNESAVDPTVRRCARRDESQVTWTFLHSSWVSLFSILPAAAMVQVLFTAMAGEGAREETARSSPTSSRHSPCHVTSFERIPVKNIYKKKKKIQKDATKINQR